MKIISVVGARPNFMKIAPLCRAITQHNLAVSESDCDNNHSQIENILVHTGQHYDQLMSGSFFKQLGIPNPDINLDIGSGSHAEQVGKTMIAFERVVRQLQPDWVVVVGDVNGTLACSITAKKENTKVAHIEAGLRSFDLTMPEEVNRIVTDRLSDLLFTTDKIASENLSNEGVPKNKICEVGNIMIDTLEFHREGAASLNVREIVNQNSFTDTCKQEHRPHLDSYTLVTLHRPSNVDDQHALSQIVQFLLSEVCLDMSVVWPVHPRTRLQLTKFGLWEKLGANEKVFLLQPVQYEEMLRLNMGARLVFSDSGGIQEECCVLGTPCLTLRPNTERPITLLTHGGASILVGSDVSRIRDGYCEFLGCEKVKPFAPKLWDGKTAERIVRILAETG